MAESKAKNKKKGKTKSGISLGSKLLVAVWVLFVLGIAGVVSIFVMINNGTIGHLPSVEELQDPKDKYASEIYSADNQVLGRYFQSGENRVFVPYKGISPDLVNALIATEDIRFREHSGIDGKSLLRAIVKTGILQQSEAGGGSTVSQQLAKLLFT
ncbi:MAG: transglycosylase domain-containing protein, partial [Paludibacteraceae bacterium]|nr:transglycosylase domain-containing protein [Paludibacteraceae bacterium]